MPNWNKTLIEYDANNNPIYIGMAREIDKKENDPGWYLKKLTWDASGNMVEKKKQIGTWTNRTDGWNI